MFKKIITSICFLFLIINIPIKALDNKIVDNANIFNDEKIINNSIVDFYNKYNIDIYFYTTEISNQENFEKIIDEYKNTYVSKFILFYISKDMGNICIYASEDLNDIINNVNKMVVLKSMQVDLLNGNFEQAMICAIDNLKLIIDTYENNKIENEKMELNLVENEKRRKISIIGMSVFSIIFIFNLFNLVNVHKKEKKEKINNEKH